MLCYKFDFNKDAHPSFLSVVVIKTLTKSNMKRKQFLWLILEIITEESQGRSTGQEL